MSHRTLEFTTVVVHVDATDEFEEMVVEMHPIVSMLVKQLTDTGMPEQAIPHAISALIVALSDEGKARETPITH